MGNSIEDLTEILSKKLGPPMKLVPTYEEVSMIMNSLEDQRLLEEDAKNLEKMVMTHLFIFS